MKISLKKKKLTSGKISLYIEYYKGKVVDADGKTKHNRDFEYLKLYLHENPRSAKEKQENKETQTIAENILSIRQAEYVQGKYNLKDHNKPKELFLDYFERKKQERYESEQNYANWHASQKHLLKYCPKSLMVEEVTPDFIRGFKKYLDTEARTTANVSLSQNSKYTYYNKFKACINAAYDEGYFSSNPLRGIKGFEMGESQREYLTFEELQALYKAECKYQVLKKAFLFSCLAGLRWSDVNKLLWSEVREETDSDGNPYFKIIFRQEKTDGLEYLYISDQARTFLGERKSESDRVFQGLKYSSTYNAELVNWSNRAGITKHITFHCSRHTCAVLMLENGADLYTVSKFLGHRELRTTQIYAKIVDRKMKEAANIIPELEL